MEDKLNLTFEINELQMNLVDVLMQANQLFEKYEQKKNSIKFSKYNINKIEETEYYKAQQYSLKELQDKFNDFKNEINSLSKLDMFKTLEELYEFMIEDISLIVSFEGIELDEEMFVYNYVKLMFAQKFVDIMTQIILEINN